MFNNSSKICLLLVAGAASLAASGQSPPMPQAGGQAGGTGPTRVGTLVVVPEKGQSAQQLWADRYACDAWAKSQSGYDPNGPASGGVSAANSSARSNYRSATIACLQMRGYSVRDALELTPPPPAQTPAPEAPPGATRHYVAQVFEPTSEFQYRPLTGQIEGGYTVTQGDASRALQNGWNGGLGLAWTPIAALPVEFRFDGSYSRFEETDRSLQLIAQRTGATGLFIFGHESLYGGDADAQIDLRMGPTVREYFFGGVGWYREQTRIRQVSFESGVRCGFFACYVGYVPVVSTVEQSTTAWLHSWNAGMGFEFALTPPGSFFVEARYLRIGPANNRTAFVPIRLGLRF